MIASTAALVGKTGAATDGAVNVGTKGSPPGLAKWA
jgi:hypothetical protein